MAVPIKSLKATLKPPCTALGDVTVNVKVVVPPVPSLIVGLLIVSVSVSSLVMVPVATAPLVMAAVCTAVAAVTVPNVSVNCSLASMMASPVMFTAIVCVSPAVPMKVSGLVVVTV